jgi:hypothetical protein
LYRFRGSIFSIHVAPSSTLLFCLSGDRFPAVTPLVKARLNAPGKVRMSFLRVGHAASALTTTEGRLETTNRSDGRCFLGLACLVAATSVLKAARFIVAMLLLW